MGHKIKIRRNPVVVLVAAIFLFTWILVACQADEPPDSDDRLSFAAGTATALIADAQSTIIVAQAQAQATSMMRNIAPQQQVSLPAEFVYTQNAPGTGSASLVDSVVRPTPEGVQATKVTISSGGAYLIVEYLAPVRLAETWTIDEVYAFGEATSTKYILPSTYSIDQWFVRPREDGKPGYIMLVNQPFPLKTGDLVTVVLGTYVVEHLEIQ